MYMHVYIRLCMEDSGQDHSQIYFSLYAGYDMQSSVPVYGEYVDLYPFENSCTHMVSGIYTTINTRSQK